MNIFGNGIALSEKAMDYLWIREEIINNNIGNVDTPGYKSMYLDFESELSNNMKKYINMDKVGIHTDIAKTIKNSGAELHVTRNESSRADGNNVDMDQEQVELARTAIHYQYTVNSINNDIRRIREAIKSF